MEMMNKKFKVVVILLISFTSILIFSSSLLQYSFPHIVIGIFDFCFILITSFAIHKISTKNDF